MTRSQLPAPGPSGGSEEEFLVILCTCIQEGGDDQVPALPQHLCCQLQGHQVVLRRNFKSLCVFNLRSCHLRLTLGDAPLCRLIYWSVNHNKDGWVLLVRRKLPLLQWFSVKIYIIETQRRAQDRPTCSIFEQKESWTEPQVLRSTHGQGEHIALYFFKIKIKSPPW